MTEPTLQKFDGSYFLVDGEEVEELPRVTEVISGRVGSTFENAAMLRGKRVHRWTEALDRREVQVEHLEAIAGMEVERFLQAWIAFKVRHEFEPAAIEAMVWGSLGGREYGGPGWGVLGGKKYAGTVDRVGTIKNGSGQLHSVLLDIKTTSQARPGMSSAHGMQLAAYAHTWRQRWSEQVDRLWIVYLRADGTFDVKDYAMDGYLAKFQAKLLAHYEREEDAVSRRDEHGDSLGAVSPGEPG